MSVGVTAIPDPLSDLDAEWVWHGFLLLMSQSIVATRDQTHSVRLTVDSKAMRKVKASQSLVIAIRNNASAGTPVIDFMSGFRTLVGE